MYNFLTFQTNALEQDEYSKGEPFSLPGENRLEWIKKYGCRVNVTLYGEPATAGFPKLRGYGYESHLAQQA